MMQITAKIVQLRATKISTKTKPVGGEGPPRSGTRAFTVFARIALGGRFELVVDGDGELFGCKLTDAALR